MPERTGAIYDLGYRGYDGPRLGRRHAFMALFVQGFRAAFGLGRRPAAKIAPFLLAALAVVPAVIYLGMAALIPADLDLIATADYLQIIFIVLILFVAAVAPEVVGRDLRYRTLSLYFTRPVHRDDYAFARVAAVAAALLAVTLVPQAVLVAGNALADDNAWDYLKEEWAEFPRVIVSGAVAALYAALLGLAVACHTPRRSFAMGGVVALFVIAGFLSGTLSEFASGWFTLLDPGEQLRAATLLIFNLDADSGERLGRYDIPPVLGVLVMLATMAVALGVVIYRYRTVRA